MSLLLAIDATWIFKSEVLVISQLKKRMQWDVWIQSLRDPFVSPGFGLCPDTSAPRELVLRLKIIFVLSIYF